MALLQGCAYEAAEETADHGRAKHAPVVITMVAAVVTTVVVVVPRLVVMLRGRRRRVPRDFVSVGGFRRLDMPVGWSLSGMLSGCGRLCGHRGGGLAFCRSSTLWRGSGGPAERAAKCECHHQFLKCVVHGRVPFFITRKPILALTQGKENLEASSDNRFLRQIDGLRIHPVLI